MKFALNAPDRCRGMLCGTRIVEKFLGIACVWKCPMPIRAPLFAVMTATATAVTDAALSATGAALNVMDAALIEAVGARRVGLGLLVVAMMLAVGHVAAVAHRVLVRLHGIGSGAGARSMIGSASAAEVERQQVGG